MKLNYYDIVKCQACGKEEEMAAWINLPVNNAQYNEHGFRTVGEKIYYLLVCKHCGTVKFIL